MLAQLPSAAHAGEATLWACHGPGGQALGVAGLAPEAAGDGEAVTFGTGCDAPASALGQGGVRAAMTSEAPAAGSVAAWTLELPADVALTGLRATRRTTGFGGAPVPGGGLRYAATTTGGTIEAHSVEDGTNVPLDGTLVTGASGAAIRFAVACMPMLAGSCSGPGATPTAVDIGAIGAVVRDDAPPAGAVGGIVSPAAGTLSLSLRATDAGLGLAEARVLVDGQLVAVTDIGGAACAELSPVDTTIDVRAGAACPARADDVPLAVATTGLPDGEHRLQVLVRDVAGNTTAAADEMIVVANTRPTRSASAVLDLGGGGSVPASTGGTGTSGGGATGAGETGGRPGTVACARPRLTMALRQRPLRRSRGIPVLRRGGRYRFSGRLTCVVGGRRVSAPRDTVVEILNVIGRRTLRKSGTTVRARGEVTAILAYRSSRLIRFRFRSADGNVAQVSIRIVVSRRSSR